jgi:hypothetical protein
MGKLPWTTGKNATTNEEAMLKRVELNFMLFEDLPLDLGKLLYS